MIIFGIFCHYVWKPLFLIFSWWLRLSDLRDGTHETFSLQLMVWRRQLTLRLKVHLPKICMALQLFQTESQESVNSSSTDVTVNSSFWSFHWNRQCTISLKLIRNGSTVILMIFEVSYFKVVVAHNREAELKSQDLVKTWSTFKFGINVVPKLTCVCFIRCFSLYLLSCLSNATAAGQNSMADFTKVLPWIPAGDAWGEGKLWEGGIGKIRKAPGSVRHHQTYVHELLSCIWLLFYISTSFYISKRIQKGNQHCAHRIPYPHIACYLFIHNVV